jgi:hypothetical protein
VDRLAMHGQELSQGEAGGDLPPGYQMGLQPLAALGFWFPSEQLLQLLRAFNN